MTLTEMFEHGLHEQNKVPWGYPDPEQSVSCATLDWERWMKQELVIGHLQEDCPAQLLDTAIKHQQAAPVIQTKFNLLRK